MRNRILSIVAAFITVTICQAQISVSVNNITMKPGELKEITFSFDRENESYRAFQLSINLPVGFTIEKYESGKLYSYSSNQSYYTFSAGNPSAQTYKFIGFPNWILKNGESFSILLRADNHIAGGVYSFVVEEIKFSKRINGKDESVSIPNYSFTINVSNTASEETIIFADSEVKSICISNWDTNGDGELSKTEAAAVKDIGMVFAFNNTIRTFDEFQYFTGITYIIGQTFQGCTGLTSITIPKSVTYIDSWVFYNCSALNSISVESGNSVYDSRDNCNAIIETTSNKLVSGCQKTAIPNSVTTIGSGAFSGCTGLTSVIIPNTVRSIEDYAFYDCNSLTSITIGNSVKIVGNGVFYGCSALKEVHITDLAAWCDINFGTSEPYSNPLEIANHLFINGKEIHELVIPNSVMSIGYLAFLNCAGLTSVTIGNSVRFILETAFWKCKGLTSVTIGNSVENIGSYAFGDCIGLKEVHSLIESPFAINANVFDNVSLDDVTLYVPKGTKKKYQSTDGWKNFSNINDGIYTLTYIVDGKEYKTIEVEYGAAITPEPRPTKEGYVFSGWSGIPSTMPAKDVTVTGTFTKGSYTLTYVVNDEVYKTVNYDYGATITPEPKPTKEGYTFSGWSGIPSTMPAKDVTVTGSFTANYYTLTYMVDGEVYKSNKVEYGTHVSPETAPTKEGYTFSGWSDIPGSMPAHDVTVTGTYTVNKYKLTYVVDGKEYKTIEVEYGAAITPEPRPTKDGYAFSGWSGIPSTMPAKDVTVTGYFKKNDDNEITVEINFITYYLSSANIEAEVKSISSGNYGNLMIPESVEYGGRKYSVTSIGDDVFSGCGTILTVTIPNSIITVGDNIFKGTKLLSLVWNSKTVIKEEMVSSLKEEQPNVLIYVPDENVMPKTRMNNIVVNGTAKNVELTDNSPFYCSKEFKAENISFTHNFQMETGKGSAAGWETIALPFTVQKVSHENKGEIIPFANYSFGSNNKPFWLYEYTSKGFVEAKSIEANSPYLICMPNNPAYRSEYCLNGKVTFAGTNVTVKKTDEEDFISVSDGKGKTFKPSFKAEPQSNKIYAINAITDYSTDTSGKTAGSIFIQNLRDVRPFEAYFETSTAGAREFIPIEFADEAVTGLEEILYGIKSNSADGIRIYNMAGQLVRNSKSKMINDATKGLPAGIYVINGKKVVVK